jgi:hypothetical protein
MHTVSRFDIVTTCCDDIQVERFHFVTVIGVSSTAAFERPASDRSS